MSSVKSRVVALIVSASLLACAQERQYSTAPALQTAVQGPTRQTATGLLIPESEMEVVHSRIVRAIAMALADGQVRSNVHNALRTSPFREGKLHVKTFLTTTGSSLLAQARNTEPGLLAALDSVVALEFYMPVPAHRSQWTGGTNLLVAGVLRDDGRLPWPLT